MEARGQVPVGPPVKDPLPSYWQEPKSPLANVIEPETDNATQTYDYAILGSGISGSMIAYNLLESHPGARVIMLEAREICSGATGRNGGHTKAATYRSYPQYVSELGKEEALKIARLEYANIIATHALVAELEIDCENQLCNTIDVIYDQKTFEEGKRAIDALRADASDEEKEQREMAWYKVYEQGEALKAGFHLEIQNQNPEIQSKEEIAGAFEYLAGRIHAYQFTTGVLQHCVEKGLQLCANTPVHALQPSTKSAEPDSQLWDIFTQYSTITARNIMLATNGYTPYLLRTLQGAIVPMRGQITAQGPGTENRLSNPLSTTYSFIYRSGYEYMIPRPLPDGKQHIIIGGGLGRLPDGGSSEFGTVNDGALNSTISKYLRNSLTGYFGVDNWGKDNAEERVVQEWTGIMGATADGRPYVGPVPGMKGVWISAGFNGHGMVLCLKSAEALVRMLHGGENDGRPQWFPESFLISVARLAQARFKGRRDLQIDE